MDLSVVFLGTAGSLPTARRGLPATLIRRGGDRILVDCGEGTQRQMLRSTGLLDVDYVFLTHLHLDHWMGLPPMLKTFELRDRDKPLWVFGPPGTERALKQIGIVGRPRYGLEIGDLDKFEEIGFDGYAITAVPANHRVEAFGYELAEEERPGRFDADLAASRGVEFGPDFGRLQQGETVNGVTPEEVIGPPRPGRKVVLSGDTAPCDPIRAAAEGADLLVHEATFTEEERDRAQQTGHSTARQAALLAEEAGVKLLALTHLSTRYGGGEIKGEARAVFAQTVVPRDFDVVELPFAEKGEPELVRGGASPVPDEGPPPSRTPS